MAREEFSSTMLAETASATNHLESAFQHLIGVQRGLRGTPLHSDFDNLMQRLAAVRNDLFSLVDPEFDPKSLAKMRPDGL